MRMVKKSMTHTADFSVISHHFLNLEIKRFQKYLKVHI